MKVLILTSGLRTRFSEEAIVRPKPMAETGSTPVLGQVRSALTTA